MSDFQEPISQHIWDNKYRYRVGGQIIDHTLEESWWRVARAVAGVEGRSKRGEWARQFFDLLSGFRFLPGGRILAGAGTKQHVTLLNCFVMGTIQDTLPGIFGALKEGALTLQQGGGVGYDFSSLRPSGLYASRSGGIASGPVSFMRIWDSTCAIMQSTGARRGAMMATLRCDHPDIEAFIDAKQDPQALRHFNLSVLVTDAFMQAVHDGAKWPLVFPADVAGQPADIKKSEIVMRHWPGREGEVVCKVFRRLPARSLWQRIIKSAYEVAEPGVLFIDTINRMNNLCYREQINATNPCGEVPLPPYGACDLGSINLTQFVRDAFSQKAALDWQGIESTVTIATRFLDNVIDLSRYPLVSQKNEALNTRRIGLGITGLADVFVMLGVRYGSDSAIKLTQDIMRVVAEATWQASVELAKEKASFPAYKRNAYLRGQFVHTMSKDLQNQIRRHGMRNSHHNVIAPTGTISLFANNISSGLEPIFDAQYERHVRRADGQLETFKTTNYAFRAWKKVRQKGKRPTAWPAGWVNAEALHPKDHLQIIAAAQEFVDGAISKTIYIPEDYPFEKLRRIYSQAYDAGLKGCTIFRPNPVTGSVLTTQAVEGRGAHCCVEGLEE